MNTEDKNLEKEEEAKQEDKSTQGDDYWSSYQEFLVNLA